MGFWSTVGSIASKAVDFFTGSSNSSSSGGGSSSSSSTRNVYEPDRVKAAEIDQQTQLQLADKETERIELMKAARLELMQEEAELQMAMEKARRAGFEQMAGSLIKLQETLTNIADKRLQIIEQGSLEVIQQTEAFYQQMQADLTANSEEFAATKLPQLLNTLQQYEVGSVAHNLFTKQVEALITNQNNLLTQQMASLATRQQTVIDGIIASKNHIMTHTDQLTAQLVQQAAAQANLTVTTTNQLQAPEDGVLLVDDKSQLQQLPAQGK